MSFVLGVRGGEEREMSGGFGGKGSGVGWERGVADQTQKVFMGATRKRRKKCRAGVRGSFEKPVKKEGKRISISKPGGREEKISVAKKILIGEGELATITKEDKRKRKTQKEEKGS